MRVSASAIDEHDWPGVSRHRRVEWADTALTEALTHGGAVGDLGSPAVLAAVERFARRATRDGARPLQVAAAVRRSAAAAVPAGTTVGAFESIAAPLVRHALRTLLAD